MMGNIHDYTEQQIANSLQKNSGNQKTCAKELGVNYSSFKRLVQKTRRLREIVDQLTSTYSNDELNGLLVQYNDDREKCAEILHTNVKAITQRIVRDVHLREQFTNPQKRLVIEIGQTYGKWTAISGPIKRYSHHKYYICKCDCGREDEVSASSLAHNPSGCSFCVNQKTAKEKHKDLTGSVIGRLTVLAHIEMDAHGLNRYECVCICGEKRIVYWTHLNRNLVTCCNSCATKQGAKKRETHGLSNTAESRILRNIKSRCTNLNHPSYRDYGGRGIKLDPCINTVEDFIDAIGSLRPSPKHTVDRINVNGDYTKGNMRWALRSAQAKNKRNSSRLYRYFDDPKSVQKELHCTRETLLKLIDAGWATEQILQLNVLSKHQRNMVGKSINEGNPLSFDEATQIAGSSKVNKPPKGLRTLWRQLVKRCTQKDHHNFESYGGRQITIYDPWTDCSTFEADVLREIGSRPSTRHSLDRIDNNLGYFPGNIRWSSPKEQSNNRRSSFRINGIVVNAGEIAKKYRLQPGTVGKLLKLNWGLKHIEKYSELSVALRRKLGAISKKYSENDFDKWLNDQQAR